MSSKINVFHTPEAVTVTTAFTVVKEIAGGIGGPINVEVENVGAQALNGFEVQVKDHPQGEWWTALAGVQFDATDLAALRLATATGPHELPGASKAHLVVDVGNPYAVRFRAKTAASTTTVHVRGRASK